MVIDRKKYKVFDSKNIHFVFYKLNPGIAINELILGQRTPKIMLLDKTSDKPSMERTVIPCPHCETFHDGRTWSGVNKTVLKNWFGLFCPTCQNIIPCLRNWTSGLILIITYPIWFWWIKKWKQSWLSIQPERYAHIDVEAVAHKSFQWIKNGLSFGILMAISINLIPLLIFGLKFQLSTFLMTLPIWIITGLLFGFLLKWWLGKKSKKANNH